MHQQHEMTALRTQPASGRATGGWTAWFIAAIASLQLTLPTITLALPTEGQVVGGQATIHEVAPNLLHIQQTTDKAILNWHSFSIGANETVRFYQPSIQSIALNRVTGIDPSVILGSLQANGRIFLINPNGILFGAGAQVNVGGLLATTLQIRDDDFMAGRYFFAQDPLKGFRSVINKGEIRVSDQGFVYLVAPGVVNDGLIMANLGSVLLGSGQKATIDLMGDGLMNYTLSDRVASRVLDHEGKTLASAVSNSGTIHADGGTVILSAKASGEIFDSVINQSGIIRAQSLVDRGGVIRLEGGDPVQNSGALGWQQHLGEVKNADGRVLNTGTLDVSATEAGAAQGEITLSGQMVDVAGSILARGADQANGGKVLATSSERTIVATNAAIDTSGIGNSSAGNTVIWSDQTTGFRGTILAKGGEPGGNGGQIEVSGHELLEFTGQVNALAPNGTIGSVLLDPTDITVATGGTATLPQVDQFADPDCVAGGCTIAPATINGAGALVNLQADNDITITDAIAMTGVGIGITMQAGRDINVNAGVATNDGNIAMTANDVGAGAGRTAGFGNITGAGAINAGTGNTTLTIGTNAGGAGGVNLTGAITAANLAVDSAQAVSITNATNNVDTIAGRTTAAGQTFSYTDADALTIGTVGALNGIATNNSAITVTTTNGALTVADTAAANDIDAGTGTVALTAGGVNQLLTIAAATNVTGTGGVTYTADNMTLAGTTTATGAIATIQPNTAGQLLNLGAADAAGTLGLTSAELNTVTTGTLRVGRVNSGNLSVSAAIAPSGTNTLSLISGGTITQTATITETDLAINAVGAVTLTQNNDVTTLVANVSGAGNSLNIRDNNNGVTIGTVDGITGVTANNGAITLTAAGATSVDSLTVNQAINSGGGNIALSADDHMTLNANVSAGAGTVTINTNSDLGNIGNFIMAAGTSITTTNTSATAVQITLNNSSSATSNAILNNISTGNGGTITVTANPRAGTGGSITQLVGGVLNVGTGTVALSTQSGVATGIGTAANPIATTAGTVTTNSGNTGIFVRETDGANMSATATNAGPIYLGTQSGALTVNAVTSTGSGDITLDGGTGNIAVNSAVTTTGTVRITAPSGTVTETGSITATNLGVRALGPVTLNGANNVTTVAGNATGTGNTFSYNDTNALMVGSVAVLAAPPVAFAAVDGISTNNGPITVTTTNGALTVSNTAAALDVNAGTSTVALTVSGANQLLTISAGGGVSGTGGATYTADNMTLTGTTTTGATIATLQPNTAGQFVNLGGADAAGTLGLTDAELDTITAGTLRVGRVNSGNMTISAVLTPGGSTTLSLISGGTVTENAGATIIEPNLVIQSLDSVTLTETNAVTTLAAAVSGAGNSLSFRDANTLTIGTVDGTTGLTTSNGDIALQTGGALTINQALNSGTANVGLNAGGAVTQTAAGIITGNELNLRGSGPFTLTNTSNDMNIVGANTTGALQLTDVDDLTVGSVAANGTLVATSTGLTATGDVVLATTNGGALTIDQPIATITNGTVTLTNAGTLALNADINADGAVTQNGAGAVTTSGTRTIVTTNDAVSVLRGVTLGGDLTVSSGTGAITLNGTIDGGQRLTANSIGTTTFTGGIGNLTPLTSLTTNAGGTTALNGGSVTTTGNQTYGDAVTMNQPATLASTGGTVQFDNTVTNSAAGASVTVDASTITLNAVTTVAATNGNINFFTDTLNTNGASINAGTGAFAIAPNTVTKTIEFGDTNTARATDAYYGSNFGSIVAGSFTVGRPTQTGDIFVTGVANLTTPLTVINGGTGSLTVENAALTSSNNSNVGLVSGSGGTTLAADVNIGTGILRITTTGAIAQSGGALTADTLALAAGTGINVAQAGNDVNTLAAQTPAGGIAFRDSDGVVIGSIGASADGFHPAITGLNAGTGNAALSAGGVVMQTALIVSAGLSLQGTGPYTLTNASNDVDTVATNTTGAIQLTDVDGLTVGTVLVVGSLGAVSGITSGNNDIALITGGALTLNQAVHAGTADLGVQSAGAVTQGAAGQITANELNLQGAGPFTLTNAANDVNTVGANTTGVIQLTDIDDLTVGAVAAVGTIPAVSGLTSGNNDIALITGGALTLNQAVNAGTADFGIQSAGAVSQGAVGQITANELNLRGAGPFTLTNNTNDANTVGATTTGTIQVNDVDDLTVGSVAAVGTIPASNGITSSNNDIALVTGGALTLNQAVNAGTANVGIQSVGSVTQGVAGQITADNLNVRSAGPFALTNNNNDVNTVGASTTGQFQINDRDDLTVGSVPAVGTIPATTGITSGNNDVILITGGTLALNQPVNAGTGNIGISSGGPVTQGPAGQITADNLNLQGTGPYILTNPNNDINRAGGTVLASLVTITDIDGFVVSNVPTVGTLSAAGPFPTTLPSPPPSGELNNLAPSVLGAALNTFGYLNPEAFIPTFYVYGHPTLGLTIYRATTLYLPTSIISPTGTLLIDNRARTLGQNGAVVGEGCKKRDGQIDNLSAESGDQPSVAEEDCKKGVGE